MRNIKVDPKWRKINIGKDKFESKILLGREFRLIDGYSSLRITEIHGIDKVLVYFVN